MERRRDPRLDLRYTLSLKLPVTRQVLSRLATEDISASGLRLRADLPHGLHAGDQLEVQLYAPVPGRDGEDHLVMATDAVVVRAGQRHAALRFHAPLAY
jgi:hypothetical protein